MACTDQSSSDDNLVATKKNAKAEGGGVLTRSRADSALAEQSTDGVMSVGLSPTQEETEESLAASEQNDENADDMPPLATPEHKPAADPQRANANVNAMSVSVPNLSLSNNVNDSTISLLENLVRNRGRGNSNSNVNPAANATNSGNSLLSRGNNVCSLVRLALSSNFPGEIATPTLSNLLT